LLWSLAACSLLVPLIDWLAPGHQYAWASTATSAPASTAALRAA